MAATTKNTAKHAASKAAPKNGAKNGAKNALGKRSGKAPESLGKSSATIGKGKGKGNGIVKGKGSVRVSSSSSPRGARSEAKPAGATKGRATAAAGSSGPVPPMATAKHTKSAPANDGTYLKADGRPYKMIAGRERLMYANGRPAPLTDEQRGVAPAASKSASKSASKTAATKTAAKTAATKRAPKPAAKKAGAKKAASKSAPAPEADTGSDDDGDDTSWMNGLDDDDDEPASPPPSSRRGRGRSRGRDTPSPRSSPCSSRRGRGSGGDGGEEGETPGEWVTLANGLTGSWRVRCSMRADRACRSEGGRLAELMLDGRTHGAPISAGLFTCRACEDAARAKLMEVRGTTITRTELPATAAARATT